MLEKVVLNPTYKIDAIKAAKELCYDNNVIKRIKSAKNDNEITRILIDARHGVSK